MNFDSPESIVRYLDQTVLRLRELRASTAADKLHDTVHSSYRTSSEWLGEIKLVLSAITRTDREKLPRAMRKEINEFISFVDRAWKM